MIFFCKAKCKVIITANQGLRGGRPIELKKTVDIAIEKCPSITNVFVMKRTNIQFETNEKYKDFDLVIFFFKFR